MFFRHFRGVSREMFLANRVDPLMVRQRVLCVLFVRFEKAPSVGRGISMKAVRVASLFCFLLAALATGAQAATGVCETLPGGPIELESTGGLIGPTGYTTLGAAFADINNGNY